MRITYCHSCRSICSHRTRGHRTGTDGVKKFMEIQGYPHVSSDPEICGGAPCVAGSRVPVRVLGAYSQQGITPAQLAGEYYPWLSLAEVFGALTYYYDNLPQVEAQVFAKVA